MCALQSEAVGINQILNKSVSFGSEMSAGELQAVINGGVLQELDAQIDMYKSELQAANTMKKAIRSDITAVNNQLAKAETTKVTFKPNSAGKKDEPVTVDGLKISKATYKELQSVLKENGQGEAAANSMGKDANGNYYISKEGLESVKSVLEDKLTDLNTQTETDTIRFQSLMDARKQTLMMLSNMLSSDHQTKMAMINNMKG